MKKNTLHKLSGYRSLFVKCLRGWFNAIRVQLGALAATYGLFVTLYLATRRTVADQWGAIDTIDHFAFPLTALALPALIATLVSPQHRWLWSLYVLPGMIAFLFWYGAYFLPQPPDGSRPEGVTFTVATWNLGGVFVHPRLLTEAPFEVDIVGLQEATVRLVARTDEPLPVFTNALGFFSRTYQPVPDSLQTIGGDAESPRVVGIRSLFDVDDRVVAVYSVHISPPRFNLRPLEDNRRKRTEEVSLLIDHLQSEPYPVVVLCDCNMSDRSHLYSELSELLTDAWHAQGWGLGLTAPAPGSSNGFPIPFARVDYVWVSDDFEVWSVRVLSVEDTDHFPVLAELVLLTE